MKSNSVSYHKIDLYKIGRPRSGSPICLSRVWLQTDLDDTKSYYQLIIKKKYRFRENTNSHALKEKETLHYNTDKRRRKDSKTTASPTHN